MEQDQWMHLLREDIPAFNEYRKANPKEPVDLRGADLSGAQLVHANLVEVDLQGASLVETNLARANLSGANLRDANLERADLTDATLHRADLTGADLRGARLGAWVGEGRVCLHPMCFEQVHYDKGQLEAVIDMLNRNASWQIRYELVWKGVSGTS